MRQLIVLLSSLILLIATPALSDTITFVDGKWETTLDCDEWTGPQVGGEMCTGITRTSNYSMTGGGDTKWDQITTPANNPSGGGVRGKRQWVYGTNSDEQESSSGYGSVNFATGETEIWVRWYIRWESGFGYNSNPGNKLIYTNRKSDGSNFYGIFLTMSSGNMQVSNGGPTLFSTGTGFSTLVNPSDGSWHYVELHIKSETVTESPFDGIVQVWFDGVFLGEQTDADTKLFSTGEELGGFLWQSNYHTLPAQGTMYQDVDDLVVYNTTPPNTDSGDRPYIGPIGAGDQSSEIGPGDSSTFSAGNSTVIN